MAPPIAGGGGVVLPPGGLAGGMFPAGGGVLGLAPAVPAGFEGPEEVGGVVPPGFVPGEVAVGDPVVALLPAAAPELVGTLLVSTVVSGSFGLPEESSLPHAARHASSTAAGSGSTAKRTCVARGNTVRPMESPALSRRQHSDRRGTKH
jgi:hypothetical protein